MGAIASQITSLPNVYSNLYSDANQRKHPSSVWLAFVWGIHRGPVNSPHKWPVTRNLFPFDDVIMNPTNIEIPSGEIKKILTHSGRDKMAAIFQTTFSNAFSWMKMYQFRSKFHWSLFRRVRLTICQHWFRKWLKADQATSHYLNQCWHNSPTHICITRPQWVNISTIGFPIQFRCHLYTESGSSSLGAKEIKTERGVSVLSRPCVKFLGGMVNDCLYPVITSVPYITGRQSNQDTYNRFAAGDLKFWSLTLFCTFPKHFCIIGPTKLYCKNIEKKCYSFKCFGK